jgi:hypothetical protein
MRVEDIPAEGLRLNLTADDATRAAIAEFAGLRNLPRLEAAFELTRAGTDGLNVRGVVSATVGQTCVVTLEPLENRLEETVDVAFRPRAATAPDDNLRHSQVAVEDEPELLENGTADLGALAVEFLLLGIDPYPRKVGVVFTQQGTDLPDDRPFAALAALKRPKRDPST